MSSITKKETGGYTDKFWYPRFWDGMTVTAWFRVLWKGRFRIAPIRWAMAVIITGLAIFFNSPAAFLQRLFYGRKIRECKLVAPPIFIIGHWRSGTTLLHEYMICDERFTFADTYACFAPSHFLLTRSTLGAFASLLMPKKRPMDNMSAGLDRPQEDEFALCALGLPSPYLNMLFPNSPKPIDTNFLTLHNVTENERKTWLDGLELLLKSLTVKSPRQVILKSPPHTARVRTILERFPDAKFIHIHRNPVALFPSTYNLWMRLATDEGCQRPRGGAALEEFVLKTFEEMYDAFEEDRALLGDNQICDVAYSELVAQPVNTLRRVYEKLGIENFDSVQVEFESYASTQKSYQKNKFELAPEMLEQIKTRWKPYFDKYGYNEV
ncbi:MAG: sulfotransferase [Planctomycetaceae bacterium]|jgi:hypothetical protein|nr:sulfotransferase [Planctomycetaceae bacterium]